MGKGLSLPGSQPVENKLYAQPYINSVDKLKAKVGKDYPKSMQKMSEQYRKIFLKTAAQHALYQTATRGELYYS